MIKNISVILLSVLLFLASCQQDKTKYPSKDNNLVFDSIPQVWDEGIPLGNGITGAIVWQKNGKLRLAIDRADLWDLRPVKEFESPNYSYKFIGEQVIEKKDIRPVQQLIDARSSRDPAPTKIPGGALEFDISKLGKVKKIELDISKAACTIDWENGAKVTLFVHAQNNSTHFFFENIEEEIVPQLIAPQYENSDKEQLHVGMKPLSALGYKKGEVHSPREGLILYHQKAWGDVSYDIALQWKPIRKNTMEGAYSITSKGTWYSKEANAEQTVSEVMKSSFNKNYTSHQKWWKNYWGQSAISIPDKLIEKQWYIETYKFGAASRKDAPPICLQAVWTADNGQTPPWRGDFHNDLNTQLSYWPGYAANHLEESSVFTDWLWKIKDNSEQYTKRFFEVDGLNVACIATLTGKAIGGWSQYSHSPTASGWLAHHFYLQWKYSMDKQFLQQEAYPWVKEAARFFENISISDANGKRKLPLSSSPEIDDNKIEAWFQQTTNYDLANIRMTYLIAIEMAATLELNEEVSHWKQQLGQWPTEAINETGLMIAPDRILDVTHRHPSHLLSFHPFGMIDVSKGEKDKELILRSIKTLEDLGPGLWCGYTYAWLANMKARVFDGDATAKNLHIFINAFCSPNSFHLNGDQTKSGYSRFTYRPFTLEGNFAAASAIQEMLLQSHTGTIRVFPAIPSDWKNASFENMRAMGAFLVSATYENGKVTSINIKSEKGEKLKLLNPFTNEIYERSTKAGEQITILS